MKTVMGRTVKADVLPLVDHARPALSAAAACPRHGYRTPSTDLEK